MTKIYIFSSKAILFTTSMEKPMRGKSTIKN